MKTRPYLLHALTPLHAGTGQSVGVIDLPGEALDAVAAEFAGSDLMTRGADITDEAAVNAGVFRSLHARDDIDSLSGYLANTLRIATVGASTAHGSHYLAEEAFAGLVVEDRRERRAP